ncbi:MAG: transposase, partial [Acidobacteria bacterium]|nr:transposase [Acidobacteriota bacterium]
LLTAASVHDSQVAIALMEMSSKRVTYLYEIMDSAYDASAIYQASADRNHQPIINPHPRRKSKTQLPLLVKPQPQLCPANAERYKIRTMVERVFGRLKDEFGADKIRVRGNKKVMAHLMFSVLALTVDQLLRLNT